VRGIPAVSIYEDPRDEWDDEVEYDPRNHSEDDLFSEINVEYATTLTRFIASVGFVAAESRNYWDTRVTLLRWKQAFESLSCSDKLVSKGAESKKKDKRN
jgi:hypothetical protein